MTTKDDIFQSSFERAIGNDSFNYDFITRFYSIFTDSSKDVAKMFAHTNMSVQKTMLHDSLLMMVEYYRSAAVSEHMQRVARIHSRAQQDIAEDLYDTWMESLLRALSEFDPDYDDQVADAWRAVLRPGIDYMKSMYDPS